MFLLRHGGFVALEREALAKAWVDRERLRAGILAIDPTATFNDVHDYTEITTAADKAEPVRVFLLGQLSWPKTAIAIVDAHNKPIAWVTK